MMDAKDVLRSDYAGLEIHEVLQKPTSALLGVSAAAEKALEAVGIATVFDLGSAWLFANARSAAESGRPGTASARFGLAPNDLLQPTASWSALEDIGALPVGDLRGLGTAEAAALKTALDVETI